MTNLLTLAEMFSENDLQAPLISVEEYEPSKYYANQGKFVELLFVVNDLYYHDTLGDPIYISFRFDKDGRLSDLQAYNGFNPVYAYDQLKEKFEKEK